MTTCREYKTSLDLFPALALSVKKCLSLGSLFFNTSNPLIESSNLREMINNQVNICLKGLQIFGAHWRLAISRFCKYLGVCLGFNFGLYVPIFGLIFEKELSVAVLQIAFCCRHQVPFTQILIFVSLPDFLKKYQPVL